MSGLAPAALVGASIGVAAATLTLAVLALARRARRGRGARRRCERGPAPRPRAGDRRRPAGGARVCRASLGGRARRRSHARRFDANLAAVVRESQRQVATLASSTSRLTTLLGGNRARGQWGERVADDILRAAGFVEGVHFERNLRVEGGATRPDFTFRLPEQRRLHMDVKFPLANYARHVEARDEGERRTALRQFLADVRASVRSVTTRDYIDPEGGTLDFVLLFIPNERVYGFIHEHDARLIDDALAERVVLGSPATLFAVLAVIRRAVDALLLERHADEIVRALGAFGTQWERYRDAVETVARRFDAAQRALDEVRGVRMRQLERHIDRVEQLRVEAGIELDAPAAGTENDPRPAATQVGRR